MRRLDALGRGFGLIGIVEMGEIRLPGSDQRRETGIARHALFHGAPLIERQYAKHVFARQSVVVGNVRAGAHLFRHSLSFNRLRRSQVRMVLSGTRFFSARLLVAQSLDIGIDHCRGLVAFQFPEASLDPPCLTAQRRPGFRIRIRIGDVGRIVIFQRCGLAGADHVDRLIAGDRHEPCHGGGLTHPKAARTPPDADVNFLDSVFGLGPVFENTQGDAKKFRTGVGIKRGKSFAVAECRACDQVG